MLNGSIIKAYKNSMYMYADNKLSWYVSFSHDFLLVSGLDAIKDSKSPHLRKKVIKFFYDLVAIIMTHLALFNFNARVPTFTNFCKLMWTMKNEVIPFVVVALTAVDTGCSNMHKT